jgi:hypothetical protein
MAQVEYEISGIFINNNAIYNLKLGLKIHKIHGYINKTAIVIIYDTCHLVNQG